eukprot:361984_1
MSILFFSLLVSLFTYTSSLTTTITPGWVDDFVYSRDDRSDGVNWYDGSWDASDGDLDDSDTFDGVDIHGWYAKTSTENGDKIERRFQCPYYSDVVISFSVYFCYKAGNTPFVYYFRNRIIETEGNAVTFEYNNDNTHGGTDWATKANGPCGRSAKKATITDEFKLKSNDKFIISVNKELKGNTGEQYSAFAVSITCTQIVTDLPTTSPTSTTATPSTPPTKYPTKFPSQDPSESPSKYPTESPVTARPSESPITNAPTKSPSKYPTVSPSDTPSKKPTEGPTQKPTPGPTARPSMSPTSERDAGRMFSDAFGGTTNPDCQEGMSWVECNLVVFIILLCVVIGCCCYWLLGGVWAKKRQDNRPDPSQLVKADSGMEMEKQAHATANKWKSAWEMEQEAAGGGGGDGGDGGNGGDGDDGDDGDDW